MEASSSNGDKFNNTNESGNWGTHWHCRLMSPTLAFETDFIQLCRDLIREGKLVYAIIGKEKGNEGKQHLQCAFGTPKSINKFGLAGRLRIRHPSSATFSQWYLSPIYSSSNPEANAAYCRKGGNVLLDIGTVPDCPVVNRGAEVLKGKAHEKWVEMISLAKLQKWEELEKKFPQEYIHNGQKLRALYFIQSTPAGREHQQHLWIYGEPGTGKSVVVEYLFPNHFKKRPDNDWLGYNPLLQPGHRVVYLPDFDVQSMRLLRAENLKVMCDPQGFNANRKFAGGDQIAPGRIVVTSNFPIHACFPPGYQGIEEQLSALQRRFKQVHINEFLAENKLKLKPKHELDALKAIHNFDWSKCFVNNGNIIDLTGDHDFVKPTLKSVIDLTSDIYEGDLTDLAKHLQEVEESEEELSQPLFHIPPRQCPGAPRKRAKIIIPDSQEQ
nr:nonstructural protein [Flumine parvovirus 9]